MRKSKARGLGIKKRYIFIFLVLLLGFLVYLVLGEFDFFAKDLGEEVELDFFINDECSIIAGQLIHVINNEGNCKIMCRAHCEVREKEYSNSSFMTRENACHQCHCYCK
jgi:hypothetical protein